MWLLSNCGSVSVPLFDKSRCIDYLLILGGKMRAGQITLCLICGIDKSVIFVRVILL